MGEKGIIMDMKYEYENPLRIIAILLLVCYILYYYYVS